MVQVAFCPPSWSSVPWCPPYWLSLLPCLEFRMLSLVRVCLSGFCVEWRVTISSVTRVTDFLPIVLRAAVSHLCPSSSIPALGWHLAPSSTCRSSLPPHGQISTKPIMRQTIYSTNWLAAFGLMGPGRFTSAALAWRFEWRFGHCVTFSFQAPPIQCPVNLSYTMASCHGPSWTGWWHLKAQWWLLITVMVEGSAGGRGQREGGLLWSWRREWSVWGAHTGWSGEGEIVEVSVGEG